MTAFVTSGLFGWWGFPWGVIYTPIQLGKNLSGIFGGPDPEVPLEQLETLTRIELAVRVEAGEPLPGRRRSPSRKPPAAPADDRIPVECDDCGKRFKAKASMAGKSGKCPGCGSRITVPEEDVWVDDDDIHDAEDEWGDDAYGDYGNDGGYEDSYDDEWDQPASSRRSTKSRGRSKPKKKRWTPVRIGLFLGLGFVALNILGGLVALIVGLFADDDPAPQFGQNNPVNISEPAQPDIQPPEFPNPNEAAVQKTPQGVASDAGNNSQPVANALSPTGDDSASDNATSEIRPVPPLNNANPNGSEAGLWID